jgi:YHS domain-containing protein
MDTRVFVLSVGLAGVMSVAGAATGQHEGHPAGAAVTPSAAQVAQCRQVQPVIAGLLNATLKRLEEARLTNSAAAMRDAADDVQAALVDMRAQLTPCSEMQVATVDAHAGHAISAAPSPPPAAATAVKPVGSQRPPAAPAADPHAGHVIPADAPVTAPRTPSAAARSSTAAPRSAAPAASDAHAEHALPPTSSSPAAVGRATAAAPPTNIADLKCTNAVDPKTAPRMLYQGRMYYFCTESSRADFAKNPSKYVTAPPQAGPPHAH